MPLCFDRAVEHDEARAGRRLRQLAALGEIGDGMLLVAIVMHQDAADRAVGIEFADEDGEARAPAC